MGRDCSDTSTSQGPPGNRWKTSDTIRDEEGLSLWISGERGPANTLILDLYWRTYPPEA